MGWYYLDTSVALHALVHRTPTVATWLEQVSRSSNRIFASQLLELEIIRGLRARGRAVSLKNHLLSRVDIMAITPHVLNSAGRITQHIKSLDAIHLGTALDSGLDCTVVTHDATMARVAQQLGYHVLDPVR